MLRAGSDGIKHYFETHGAGRPLVYWLWEAMTGGDELEEDFAAQLRHTATHIMGRVTYRNMAAHWLTSTEPVVPVMNDIPKVVSFPRPCRRPAGRSRGSPSSWPG